MTKLATATCAMQLVEQGLISLDDDTRPLVPALGRLPLLRGFVGRDIPFLEDQTPTSAPITLRHLLTHTVGLGYAGGDPDYARWAKHVNRKPEEQLRGTLAAWETPLKFPPGTGWYYGSAVDWAGQVVEAVSGKTLGSYMAENLFGPLGMGDSTFRRDTLPHVQDRTVPSSRRDADTGELRPGEDPFPPLRDGDVESGGTGLYTTAADYAKLLQALLRSLGGAEGTLLKRATVEEMVRPQLTGEQSRWLKFLTDLFHDGFVPDFERGMSLDHGISGVINMEDEPGKRRKGSLMWGGLCNGHWFIDPASGIGATLFTNILPQPDAAVSRVWDELERAVYSDLLPSLGS